LGFGEITFKETQTFMESYSSSVRSVFLRKTQILGIAIRTSKHRDKSAASVRLKT